MVDLSQNTWKEDTRDAFAWSVALLKNSWWHKKSWIQETRRLEESTPMQKNKPAS